MVTGAPSIWGMAALFGGSEKPQRNDVVSAELVNVNRPVLPTEPQGPQFSWYTSDVTPGVAGADTSTTNSHWPAMLGLAANAVRPAFPRATNTSRYPDARMTRSLRPSPSKSPARNVSMPDQTSLT